ncbi:MULTISPECIES: hypothetical protein [unclassified Streptomyces]|uniref:Lipoprotein n=1 Tax=Streptomyces niveiscabiei TaxID=164115 RepID=A0ABW9HVW1_9ACTN|nr:MULTISPECIES: hypothetical protein [unclassified Streptomyces]
MRKGAATAALIVVATLTLGACGKEHTSADVGGAPAGTSAGTAAEGGTAGAGGVTPEGATPGTPSPGTRSTPDGRNTSEGRSTSASPTTPPAPAYVEPGAGDGAPHYRENNGFRIPAEMSPASAADAQREAARIEPVLKRLWQQKKWDPATVRTAMLQLGYKEEHFDAKGQSLGGTLQVKPMDSRYENGGYVTPEGARVGLRVHDDACVTAFVQKTNYQVSTNGPYPEGGCFEPQGGH